MKRHFLYILYLSLSLLVSATTSLAQTRSDVSTPKGSNVVAYIPGEQSNAWRAGADAYYAAAGRTQISYFNDGYSSSTRFNCHGYAWHMSEGGGYRWVGYYVTTDEDIYMTDGSYVQVCSAMYPGKVSWADGDHSAITTSTAGVVLSKWGSAPLMYHNISDNPYGTSYKYYVPTTISGSLAGLCIGNTRTFSVVNIPGATYSWSTSYNVSGSSSSNQITVTANYDGAAWVEVQISTPCSASPVTRRVNFAAGPNNDWIAIWQNQNCHQTYSYLTFQINNPQPGLIYEWGYFGPNDGSPNWTTYNATSAGFVFYTTGSYGIVARAHNACGAGYFSEIGIELVNSCSGFRTLSVTASPNPVSGDLYVTLGADKSTVKTKAVAEDVQMQLYDLYRTRLIKQWSFKSNQPTYKLDVRSVKKGQYVLQVKKGTAIQVKQIIVQ